MKMPRYTEWLRLARIPVGAALAVSALAGCSTFGAYEAFSYRKTRDNPNPEKVLTYSYDPAKATVEQTFFKTAYAAATDKKAVRNRIVYELMGVVDDYYFRYTAELRADTAGKGLIVDTTALATSLASTAAGANEVKTILSAISTATQGLSKSIDANVLIGNTAQAIRLQMDASRAAIGTEMITKMKDQSVAEYPLEAGLRDVVRYYDAGTLTSGVAALAKQSGTDKATQEKKQTDKATGADKLHQATPDLPGG